MKVAVVLFNLGGPDARENIEPFLMNFFMDKNIIGAPLPVRWALAKLISKRRSKREAGESYGFLNDRSPLLANSEAQAQALENKLNSDKTDTSFKVFVCMSYWHPMADAVVRDVMSWGADKIICLPLYPQYSTTTTKTALAYWDKAKKRAKCNLPDIKIGCYPFDEGFIKASAQNVSKKFKKMKNARMLFSAHGLPEKIVKKGDPYQWQCEQSAAKIAKAAGVSKKDWQICYQSRVGPLKWIGPSTEEALEQAAKDGKNVLIYPHAFTQEHVETLVELGIEYKELAEELGIKKYDVVETVGTSKPFIKGLANIVTEALDRDAQKNLPKDKTYVCAKKRLCPPEFKNCPCVGIR